MYSNHEAIQAESQQVCVPCSVATAFLAVEDVDYWRNGALPDNDAVLAQITLLSPDAWAMHQASLKHFFKRENGLLVHARVEKELAKAGSKQKNLSKRGKHGAATRWASKNKTEDASANATSNAIGNATGIAQAMPNSMLADAPSQSHSDIKTNTLALTGERESPSELLLEVSLASKEPSKARKAPRAKVSDAIVDAIYDAYPLHEKPGKAKTEICAAVARIAKADGISQHEAAEKLLELVKKYAVQMKKKYGAERTYITHPANWFKGEGYNSESLAGRISGDQEAVQYTDPVSVYESPEYQNAGARRSA